MPYPYELLIWRLGAKNKMGAKAQKNGLRALESEKSSAFMSIQTNKRERKANERVKTALHKWKTGFTYGHR